MPFIPSAALLSNNSQFWPLSALEVYVDYVHGSDVNDGLAPTRAFQTIAAAYSTLQTRALATYSPGVSGDIGVGRIYLMPGEHDVGTGLVIDYRYTVEIVGFLAGYANPSGLATSSSIIYSSSSSATSLVLTGSSSNVTYGNMFRDLTLRYNPSVNTALIACLKTQANDYLMVDGCRFYTSDSTNRNVPAILMSPGGSAQDNMQFRVTRNRVSGMPLFKAATGTNFNRGTIRENSCFLGSLSGGGYATAMIHLEGDVIESDVSMNDLEGATTAVLLGSSANRNVLINNSGESANGTNPFYDCAGGWNQFIGGYCDAKDSSNGTWIIFQTSGYDNIVMNRVDFTGTNGQKKKVVDGSTYGNTVIDARGGTLMRQKTGAAPTWSDSDFVAAPPDGTTRYTYGSIGPVYKMWGRVNGSWKSVEFT